MLFQCQNYLHVFISEKFLQENMGLCITIIRGFNIIHVKYVYYSGP